MTPLFLQDITCRCQKYTTLQWNINTPGAITDFCSNWISSGLIHGSEFSGCKDFCDKIYNSLVITMWDGLALLDAKPSAGTLINKTESFVSARSHTMIIRLSTQVEADTKWSHDHMTFPAHWASHIGDIWCIKTCKLWQTFCWQHFQIHFIKRKHLKFNYSSLKFVSKSPIEN